ncbi:cell envelope integrity protein CreD [Massilia sp. CF038]|uniref:cell envelope integrity protein CreD n=1 Tax=Massilia sp. CF038 TaxID=1881045 RepID=UPI00090F1D9C|nr:cell envelope integrity protein CreD [Massilia sp. CF038]SHH59913.1 inner membrane protein [Massilia sp. CF038]
MQRTLLFKILIILGITVLIAVALGMIQSTINDRAQFRDDAVKSVSSESVREQTITGPILVVPYVDEYVELIPAKSKNEPAETVRRSVTRKHLVFPNQLDINGKIDTYRRYRGIHQVLMYGGVHAIKGDFALPALNALPRASPNSSLTLRPAYLALGIEDVRGIADFPKVDWNGGAIEFQQGSGLQALRGGLHADLPAMELGGKAKFSFTLKLNGIERQHVVPVGKNNTITLASNWPHPQFGGDFLPSPERTINENGFNATWTIASLATNAQQQLRDIEVGSEPGKVCNVDSFSVAFIEPVNVYSMAERATKYGLLFVALTFAAFFMFEVLKLLPIHPVQYLLVGLALVLFFLLLVSLSEHIAFLTAYLIASAACILLIGYYLAAVLRDWTRGLGFGTALTLLYGALYGLLVSENNALVLGSILLFAVLSGVMVATRKVDWYQIGKTSAI